MNRQVKVVVVGQENVGKTTLIETLKLYYTHGSKKFKKLIKPERGESTEGIFIENFSYTPPGSKEAENLIFKFWDFSGLEIFHTTHNFFLTEDAVYVVVWKLTSHAENSRVPYWLQTIHFHAPKSPILLVTTHLDTLKRKKIEKFQQIRENFMEKYKSQFPTITDVYGVSSTTGQQIKGLGRALESVVRTQAQVMEGIPDYYQKFQIALSRVQAHKIDNLQKGAPVLEWEAVERVGDKCQVPRDKLVQTIKFFESVGDLVYFPGAELCGPHVKATGSWQLTEKNGFIIVEPQWITQLFASIVSNQNNHVKNGILSQNVLENVIWTPPLVPKEIHAQLFRVLVSFEIVFHIQGSDTILIPSLLGPKPENFQTKWPSHDPSCFHFAIFYHLPFFPSNLFSKFLVQLFQLKYKYSAWKTGILIEHAKILTFVEHVGDRIFIYARSPELDKTLAILFSTVHQMLEALLSREKVENVSVAVPCPLCLDAQLPNPTLFEKQEIENAVNNRMAHLTCRRIPTKPHQVPLVALKPDLATIDIESKSVDLQPLIMSTPSEILSDTTYNTKYKVIWQKEAVVIKLLKIPKGTRGIMVIELSNALRQEVHLMSRFDHPCIVQLKGYSLNNPAGLITEYFESGDLVSYLSKRELSWPIRLRIAYDVASALYFLHHLSPPVVMRNLKSSSIMVTSTDPAARVCAKLTEFSSARDLDLKVLKEERLAKPKDRDIPKDIAHIIWLAPEILKDEDLTPAVDVYPYGLILWHMLSRELPFKEYVVISELEFDILSGKRPDIPNNCPIPYTALIKSCCLDDPQERPLFPSVLDSILKITKLIAPEEEKGFTNLHHYTKHGRLRQLSVSSASNTPKKKVSRTRSSSLKSKTERVPNLVRTYTTNEKVEMGFVPHASNSLVERWKGTGKTGLEPTIVQIEERLLVCPYPGNLENIRNFQVELESLPPDYKVYNLSYETYDYSVFTGVVVEYQMESKEAPSLKILQSCVDDIVAWLEKSENSIVLLHGYTRSRITTVVAAAVLLKLKKYKIVEEAINHVKGKFNNSDFPSLEPSQKRYLQYYAESLIGPPKQATLYLHKLKFSTIPNFKFTGGCDPIYCIQQEGRTIFFSKKMKGRKDNNTVEFFCRDINVSGDIKIEFFHKSCSHKMFSLGLNTHYEMAPKDNKLVFERTDLDLAWKDSAKKHYQPGFKLEIFLLTQHQHHEMNKKMKKATVVEETTAERKKKMAKNKRPSSRLMKSFFPKPKEDGSESESTSGGEHGVSFAYDPDICFICKKPILIQKGEDSIGILPGVTVHYSCLECADCGASLRNRSLETVVKGDRIVCNNCEKEIFPKCTTCNKVIKGQDIATHGDHCWHPECLPCTKCKTPIKGSKFKMSELNGNSGLFPYCSPCSEKNSVHDESPPTKTPQEEELEQLLGEALGRHYFGMHLKDEKVFNLLEFWIGVEERREEPKAGRIELAPKLDNTYLKPGGEKELPSHILSSFPPLSPNGLDLMARYDKAQKLVFADMAQKYMPTWTSSPHFMTYITALVSEDEQETKEDDIRRAAAKQFVPVLPSDFMSASMVVLDLDENMMLIEVNLDTGEKEEVKGEQPEDLISVVFAEAAAAASKAREIAELVDKKRVEAQQRSKDKALAALDQMMDNVIATAFAGAEIEIQRRRAPPGQKKVAQDLDRQLNLAILQAFGGKQAHVTKECKAEKTGLRENPTEVVTPIKPPPASINQQAQITAAKRKMAELWVNGSLQQAKFSFEVAENARKAVEASFEVVQKAYQLANQEHRPLDVVEKAVGRIVKEAEVIEAETKKAQNSVIVVQKASNEARSNGPDLPQTAEVAAYVDKVADEVRAALKLASRCPALVEKAHAIFNDRKAIATFLTGDLDALLT